MSKEIPDESVFPGQGDLGTKEDDALGNRTDLSQMAEEGDFWRNEQMKQTVSRVSLSSVWVAWVLLLLMALSLVSHFLIPETWFWLTDAQLDTLKGLFTGGAIVQIALQFRKEMVRRQ